MDSSLPRRLDKWLDKAKLNTSTFWTAVTLRTRTPSIKTMDCKKRSLRQIIKCTMSVDSQASKRIWSKLPATTKGSTFIREGKFSKSGESSTPGQEGPPRTKRRCVQSDCAHCHSPPPRTIPPEILQLIFLFAIEEHDPCDHYTFPAISHVSQSWRTVSLSMPTLWNKVVLDSRQSLTAKSSLSILKLLLQRSRDATLHVYVRMPTPSIMRLPALNLLLEASDRWTTATIELSTESISDFHPVRGRLSSLQRLELKIVGHTTTNDAAYGMFEFAPNLREASIHGDWLATHFSLPWSQLVQYRDTQGNNGGSHYTIKSFISMKRLSITWKNDFNEFESDDDDDEFITLPSLERLDVDFIFPSYQGFLERLILPNVKELNIGNHLGDPIPRLISMTLRSHTPSLLRKLTLYTQFHRPGGLTLLLSLLPHLQELDIYLPDAIDLDNLDIKPGARVLVPELRHLRFVADSTSGLEHYLNSIASSRCEWKDGDRFACVEDKTHPIQTLSHFSITLRDGHNRFGEREYLEQSEQSFPCGGDQATLNFLRLSREAIIEFMPWIGNGHVKPTKMTYSRKRLGQLDAIFTALLNWKIGHAGYLYRSHLHIALHFFKNQPVHLTPGDKRHRFQQRASQILEKWSNCLWDDIVHRHWIVEDAHTLRYVSNDDDLRTSIDALAIIYGLDRATL